MMLGAGQHGFCMVKTSYVRGLGEKSCDCMLIWAIISEVDHVTKHTCVCTQTITASAATPRVHAAHGIGTQP